MKHGLTRVIGWVRLLVLALGLTAIAAQADEYSEVSQWLREGKLMEAQARVERYLAVKPRDPQMHLFKGVIQRESGRQSEALATFTQLSEDYPDLPEPYNNLAVILAAQGQYDKARVALEKDKNMTQYLAAYGTDFQPAGHVPRSAWEEDRRLRITGKSRITINLLELRVTVNGNRAVAKFRQAYKADTLAVTSRKTLELAKTGDRWLIVKEYSGN